MQPGDHKIIPVFQIIAITGYTGSIALYILIPFIILYHARSDRMSTSNHK